MAKSKIVDVNEKIANGVTTGYKKIEDGESVEDAKKRLKEEQRTQR